MQIKWFRLGALAGLLLVGAASFAQSLKIGDPAPAIQYSHWIKGDPIQSFEPGKVYVVEFWATWCGPCRMSMPHLTELAKKYDGKATFIGVDVRQTEHADGALKTVQDFVTGNSENMGYRVAMDDPEKNTVFDAWMTAAGVHGIPTSFVVDGHGKVVWVGHPMMGLDEAISQTLNGTIDLNASEQVLGKEIDQAKKAAAFSRIYKPLESALEKKDYATVYKECEKIIASDPADASFAISERFDALLHLDEGKAFAEFGTPMGTVGAKQADLNRADTIVYQDGLSERAYTLALKQLLVADFGADGGFFKNRTLAMAYSRVHRLKEAIQFEDKAIEEAAKMDKGSGELVKMSKATRDELVNQLKNQKEG